MKRYSLLFALSFFSLNVAAQTASPCLEKQQSIQRELGYAEQHQNTHRIAGLKKALSEVQAHCNDDKVRAEHQEKIAEQREKVAERKKELAEAQIKGDAKKVSKKQSKLSEAEHELKQLESRDY